jgi:hypothetical protein
VPALPSWLTEPLWDQFVALLPEQPEFHPDHPLGCHRRRISEPPPSSNVQVGWGGVGALPGARAGRARMSAVLIVCQVIG